MNGRTEDLVTRLVAELRPVQRLPAPGWRAAGWLAGAAAVIGAAVAWHGLRHDIGAQAALPYEVGQWLASVVAGVLAAVAAFLVALPDRSPRQALLPLPALAIWLYTLGWGCFEDFARTGPQALALETSWTCLRFIAGLGLPLLASMLWTLRHARPIRPAHVALLGGLASATLCSAGLSLFHYLDAASMILLWHGGAVVLVTATGGAIGRLAQGGWAGSRRAIVSR